MVKVDLAIIGGGFCGLSAARCAQAQGLSFALFEGRRRVGGRALSIRVAGEIVELGAQWIGPGQDKVRGLATEFGLVVQPRPEEGAECFYLPNADGQAPLCRADGPSYKFEDIGAAVVQLDVLAQTVDPLDPAATDEHRHYDCQTVASWVKANLPEVAHPAVFTICEGFLGMPDMVSFLHFLFYAKANGGVAALLGFGVERHDSEVIPEGLSTLAARLAETLGSNVHYGQVVRRVKHDAGGVKLYSDDGVIAEAKAVIVAVPPIVASQIEIDPIPDARRLSVERRYTPLSRLKFQLVFARPFWRDQGLSGAISGGSFFTFDGSITNHFGVLTGFFGATEAFDLWSKPQAERAEEAMRRVRMMFGDNAPEALGYDDRFWLDERLTMGCVAAPGPGVWTNFGDALRAHSPPLFRAGAELATVMPGQIDGAIRSGIEAAEAAAQFLKA